MPDSSQRSECTVGLALIEHRCPGLVDQLSDILKDRTAASEPDLIAGLSDQPKQDVRAAIAWLVRAGALRSSGSASNRTIEVESFEKLDVIVIEGRAIAQAIPALRAHPEFQTEQPLVVSWPGSLPVPAERQWRSSRIVLPRLIDGAKSDATLLFPFIDDSGIAEVGPALERALRRGVRLHIMTRHLNDPESHNAKLVEMLRPAAGSDDGLLHTVSLTAPLETGAERELLHAKLLVIDNGRLGYVGSLNLTGSSMDEVIEVGIVVSGKSAQSLMELINDILAAATTE